MKVIGDVIATGTIVGTHLSTNAKQTTLEYKYMAAYIKATEIPIVGSSTNVTSYFAASSQAKKTGGSESAKGMITSGSFNFCQIVDTSTQEPYEDENHSDIKGRLTVANTSLTGTIELTASSTAVVGTDTLFSLELAADEWIKLDSDGVLRQIDSITDNTHLTLKSASDVSGTGAASKVVLTLTYYSYPAGEETAYTFGNDTIDVYFPEYFSLYDIPSTTLLSLTALADGLPADHTHDGYVTTAALASTTDPTGGSLVGLDITNIIGASSTNLQELLEEISFLPCFEVLTIATENEIPNLTYYPVVDNTVLLIYSGIIQEYTVDYTVSGKAITWNKVITLPIGAKVLAFYMRYGA